MLAQMPPFVPFLTENKWDCGIQVDGTNLFYDGSETTCIELKLPDLPRRAAYFSSEAWRLCLVSEEAQFQGALLWVCLFRAWQFGANRMEAR